jgi:hypothetical protein
LAGELVGVTGAVQAVREAATHRNLRESVIVLVAREGHLGESGA